MFDVQLGTLSFYELVIDAPLALSRRGIVE